MTSDFDRKLADIRAILRPLHQHVAAPMSPIEPGQRFRAWPKSFADVLTGFMEGKKSLDDVREAMHLNLMIYGNILVEIADPTIKDTIHYAQFGNKRDIKDLVKCECGGLYARCVACGSPYDLGKQAKCIMRHCNEQSPVACARCARDISPDMTGVIDKEGKLYPWKRISQ